MQSADDQGKARAWFWEWTSPCRIHITYSFFAFILLPSELLFLSEHFCKPELANQNAVSQCTRLNPGQSEPSLGFSLKPSAVGWDGCCSDGGKLRGADGLLWCHKGVHLRMKKGQVVYSSGPSSPAVLQVGCIFLLKPLISVRWPLHTTLAPNSPLWDPITASPPAPSGPRMEASSCYHQPGISSTYYCWDTAS